MPQRRVEVLGDVGTVVARGPVDWWLVRTSAEGHEEHEDVGPVVARSAEEELEKERYLGTARR